MLAEATIDIGPIVTNDEIVEFYVSNLPALTYAAKDVRVTFGTN